jgi:DNA-binding NtrC family response regulator
MPVTRILVVDDDPFIREFCKDTLQALPEMEVLVEERSPLVPERIEKEQIDLLITDIMMPEMNGVELLQKVRANDPDLPVLVITAHPTLDSSIECLRYGAADYIMKPILADDLAASVRRLIGERRLREENRLLQRRIEGWITDGEIVGRSDEILKVLDTARRLAGTDVPVLIGGETGTGKELVARSIHRNSDRREMRFVPVDCGAVPEHLIESEFFGHERGAFTGADRKSLGLMEFADGGTLFLDEIGELPLLLQAKLLRAIQEGKVRRIGGREEIPVDVRIITSTNRDLAAEVKDGRFREDLYFRIRVGEILIPPLRKRRGDIPLLFEHFRERFTREMGRPAGETERGVLEILSAYNWPGNVRELLNCVRRMLAMCAGEALSVEDIPEDIVASVRSESESGSRGFFRDRARVVGEFEREYLVSHLKMTSGDMSEAARRMEVPRRTLYRLVKRHGIEPDDYRRKR